jgi:hypothetical protein
MLDLMERAQSYESVAFAEPDEIGVGDFPPAVSSPAPGRSEFEAAGRYWNHDLTGVGDAHTAGVTGRDRVVIIIVDSGVETEHPDLSAALPAGWQTLDLAFTTGEADDILSPDSDHPHGTQVSSIAVGKGQALDAVRGIAPDCRFYRSGFPAIRRLLVMVCARRRSCMP